VTDLTSHGRRAGRVTWLRQLVNQNNRIVQKGIFVTLVAARVREKRQVSTMLNGNASHG
jgi:hypothetical protein